MNLTPRRQRLAYLSLATALALSVMDSTIANTALPTIARELGVAPAASIWVVNAFQIAITSTLFTFAALGTSRGYGRLFRWGLAVFTVASLGCALSRSLTALAIFRCVQGIGASAIMAVNPVLLREITPPDRLGRAYGANAVVIAASAALGPAIGGLVLAIAPWPWLFAINVPLGILAVALLQRNLPFLDGDRSRIDLPSAFACGIGFSLLILAFERIGHRDHPAIVAAEAIAGAAAIVAFVQLQRTIDKPLLALRVFDEPVFSLSILTSFASFIAQGLAFVALPFFLQNELHYTPLISGVIFSAWPIAIVIVAPLAGRLSDHYPAGLVSTAGLALFCAGLAWTTFATLHPSLVNLVGAIGLCGLGFGFFQAPNNRQIMDSANRGFGGAASGMLAAARVGGQTLGAAGVAMAFGILAAPDTLGDAVPAALGAAAACAALAGLTSARRLALPRPSGAGAPAPGRVPPFKAGSGS